MRELDTTSLFLGFLSDTAYLAGVPLLVATVAALTLSVFQAMTQIQDQNLSQTVKIVAITLVFVLAGKALIEPLVQRTQSTFSEFHRF